MKRHGGKMASDSLPVHLTDQQKRILMTPTVSVFTITDEHGRPHSTPVLAVLYEGILYFACHENSVKYRLIVKKERPVVSLVTVDPDWYPYLTVIGTADVLRRKDKNEFDDILERVFRKHKEDERKQGVISRIQGNPQYALVEISPEKVYGTA